MAETYTLLNEEISPQAPDKGKPKSYQWEGQRTKTENFLSIMCCAIKGKEIMQLAMNCHLPQTWLGYRTPNSWFKSGRLLLLFYFF